MKRKKSIERLAIGNPNRAHWSAVSFDSPEAIANCTVYGRSCEILFFGWSAYGGSSYILELNKKCAVVSAQET